MPFVSNAQRKRMFENKPEMAKERASKTPKGKKLPEHVGDTTWDISKKKIKSKKNLSIKTVVWKIFGSKK